MKIEMNIGKALEVLLEKMYFSEFVVIDGVLQHHKGFSFHYWLYGKEIISKEEFLRIDKENSNEE